MGNPAVVEAVDKEYILEISFSSHSRYDLHCTSALMICTQLRLTLPHPSGENQRSLDDVNVSMKSSVR